MLFSGLPNILCRCTSSNVQRLDSPSYASWVRFRMMIGNHLVNLKNTPMGYIYHEQDLTMTQRTTKLIKMHLGDLADKVISQQYICRGDEQP